MGRPCIRCGYDFGSDLYCQYCKSCGHCGCCPCGQERCEDCEGYIETLAGDYIDDGKAPEDAIQAAWDDYKDTVGRALARANRA